MEAPSYDRCNSAASAEVRLGEVIAEFDAKYATMLRVAETELSIVIFSEALSIILVERYMRQGGLILAAGRVHSRKKGGKKRRNPAAHKTHHEIHRSPATATTSRRRATKNIPRVSQYSPASVEVGYLEIGHVQLTKSVKVTNVTHTQTDGQTDSIDNGTLCAPRY